MHSNPTTSVIGPSTTIDIYFMSNAQCECNLSTINRWVSRNADGLCFGHVVSKIKHEIEKTHILVNIRNSILVVLCASVTRADAPQRRDAIHYKLRFEFIFSKNIQFLPVWCRQSTKWQSWSAITPGGTQAWCGWCRKRSVSWQECPTDSRALPE